MSTENRLHERSFLPTLAEKEYPVQVDSNGDASIKIGDAEQPLLQNFLNAIVVQPGSVNSHPEFKAHLGKLYYPDLEVSYEERTLLPITVINRGRYLFLSDFQKGDTANKPDCFSHDGILPAGENPYHTQCGQQFQRRDGSLGFQPLCPYAQWTDGAPKCRDYVNVAFLDITDEEMIFPMVMRLKGLGMSAWNEYLRSYLKTRNVARLKRRSIYDYVTKLQVVLEGTYARPSFALELSNQHPEKYLPMLEWYMKNVFATVNLSSIDEAQSGGDEALAADFEEDSGASTDIPFN